MATGKRKSCKVVVILKPGKGIVKINRTDFIKYFPCPIERRKCLKAMEMAGIACDFDVEFFITGGGYSA
ncbi:MAG: 30S ribosomal protein S9 [bacterium]